jgi:hypothetical protein
MNYSYCISLGVSEPYSLQKYTEVSLVSITEDQSREDSAVRLWLGSLRYMYIHTYVYTHICISLLKLSTFLGFHDVIFRLVFAIYLSSSSLTAHRIYVPWPSLFAILFKVSVQYEPVLTDGFNKRYSYFCPSSCFIVSDFFNRILW